MKFRRSWYLGRADGPSSAADNAEHCPYLQKARRHISVSRLLFALVVLAPVQLCAGKNEPPKPIVTPAELAAAAAEVPVMRLDFTLPDEKDPMQSDALSKRFFNTPEERRYGGVTSTDWRKKWDLFAKALLKNASKNNLKTKSLKNCLAALNYGRNKQTAAGHVGFVPTFRPLPPPGASPEQIKVYEKNREADEKEAAEKNAQLQKDVEAHPERYYDETLAIIPVGAHLAKYSKGECWIIVGKWESFSEKQPAVGLGHIMIWAMDAKTSTVVAYVTCD